MGFQKASELIKDYVSRMRTLNMVANLPRDLLREYLVTGLQPEVREYMKRTNKNSLDVAPASPEMCVEAITSAGMEVENERIQEQDRRNAQKLKEQTQAAARGKKPDQKPQADNKPEAPRPSGVQKKKGKQGEKKKSSVSSEKSKTFEKKAKEPGEDKVTYSMRQARMKKRQCIKCGRKDHIKKESTAGWKAMAGEKSKGKGKDRVDNKKVAVVQAADNLISSVISPVSFGRIISEDELDYECD